MVTIGILNIAPKVLRLAWMQFLNVPADCNRPLRPLQAPHAKAFGVTGGFGGVLHMSSLALFMALG